MGTGTEGIQRTMRVCHNPAIRGMGIGVIAISTIALGATLKSNPKLERWIPLPLWTRSISDVAYSQHSENRLDILLPRWPKSLPLPAVVVFHGGAWQRGSRSEMRERVCRRYLAHGFVVVNVEYRHGIRSASEDAVRAVEWFAANAAKYGGDPRRIVVTGESAGAHLALLAAFQSRAAVAAVINFYGISDLSTLTDATLVRDAALDGDVGAVDARLSPIEQIHTGLPPVLSIPVLSIPVLSIHGSADSVVPPDQSLRLTQRLRQAGGGAEVMLIEGAGHGFTRPQMDQAYGRVFDFLRQRGILTT